MHLIPHRIRNKLIQKVVEIAGSYPNILICTDIIDEQSAIDDDIPAREERTFVCFVPDRAKEGGEYVTVRGIVTGYDEYAKTLTLSDGRVLMIGDIQSVEI